MAQSTIPQIILERLPAVMGRNGRSRSAHYQDIDNGLFTKPIRLGGRAVAWPSHETDAILRARIRGATDDEIRQLVVQLELARKDVGGAAG